MKLIFYFFNKGRFSWECNVVAVPKHAEPPVGEWINVGWVASMEGDARWLGGQT